MSQNTDKPEIVGSNLTGGNILPLGIVQKALPILRILSNMSDLRKKLIICFKHHHLLNPLSLQFSFQIIQL